MSVSKFQRAARRSTSFDPVLDRPLAGFQRTLRWAAVVRVAFAVLIVVALVVVARAQDYGDLILGFQADSGTGESTDLEIDLGPASAYAAALTPGTYDIVNLSADLSNTFGSWASDSNLSFAIIGSTTVAQGAGGAPKRSIWASGPVGSPGNLYVNSGGLSNENANSAIGSLYVSTGDSGGFGGTLTTSLSDVTGASVTLGADTFPLYGLTVLTAASGSFSDSEAQTGNWSVPFAPAFDLFTSTGSIAADGSASTEVFFSSGQAASGTTVPDIQAGNGDYSYFSLTKSGEVTFTTVAPAVASGGGSQLSNISTRSQVGTGGNIQIAGFVIEGTVQKTVLIRASGPALRGFGVAGVLPDPSLILYSGQSVVATNTKWGSATNATTIATDAASVGAFPWTSGSADSAILITLQPGTYTAQVAGASGDAGVALVEIYDCDPPNPDSTLKNISTRSLVGTSGSIQIAGFAVAGSQPKTVLIRASGPALTGFGVSGVLPDPALTLLSGQTVVASNTKWGAASNAAQIMNTAAEVGAFSWANGSADSAILVTLQPGNYTAQVTGSSGDTGVALVEVYDADGE